MIHHQHSCRLHKCGLPALALDERRDNRSSNQGPEDFFHSRRAEDEYARQLRKIGTHIGTIVNGFDVKGPADLPFLSVALDRYSQVLAPWAASVGRRMIADVAQRDEMQWKRHSRQIGRALRNEIRNAPTGAVLQQRLADQVQLITSLPTVAAERVHKLTLEGIANGTRPAEIAKEIARSGEVSKSRATLIARTEVGRTATELMKARALHVGSTMFIWRTAGDSDVRLTHRLLNGRSFRWDDPPECDPGYHALPGAIFNCRCWPVPILPDF
jgi:SPP1 gp7 family putative phage head morphogenesis protein